MKFIQVDDVEIPDWLLEACMCEPNRGYISDPLIQDFTWRHLLRLALRHPDARYELRPCSNHVNIGDTGVTPHTHKPHVFTSVLYLEDAIGELIIDPAGDNILIAPKKGRFVLFGGDVVHEVLPSPCPEFRISLVTNYEYPDAPAV